jgi:hypothetical protein
MNNPNDSRPQLHLTVGFTEAGARSGWVGAEIENDRARRRDVRGGIPATTSSAFWPLSRSTIAK